MPRKARQKSSDSVYHIICRSISEIDLFRNSSDKTYYLTLLKRYKEKYMCSIYAYCLMDTHVHLHFDPRGYDVSKFMHSVNTAYVRYYNTKYERHGHLFQDRFESRILDTEQYNLAVSAYIHNNAKDVAGYKGKEQLYPYSSYGIYLKKRQDVYGLIDQGFMRSLFELSDELLFIKRYREFVSQQADIGSIKEIAEKLPKMVENEYISGRKIILREYKPSKVITYMTENCINGGKWSLHTKYRRNSMDYRSLCAYTLRVLCGCGYKEICENMYNTTISGCASLCDRGHELLKRNKDYAAIFEELAGMPAA